MAVKKPKPESKSKRPRRIRGEGGLSQRASDGLWIGTIDLGWHDGKRVRKTVSSADLKIAQSKFVDLKKKVEKSGGITRSSTVAAWLEHWLEHIASQRVRARTLQGYRSYIDTWLVPYLGSKRLDKFSEDHIRAMYRAMKDAGKSDATRRQAHAILRRALVVAEREGRISRNPAAMIDPPPVGSKHRKPLTLDESRKIFASLNNDSLAARWIAALLLGMRQGECLGLKWEDIDFEGNKIYIKRELLRLAGQGMVLTPPKSVASVRAIPILAPMLVALERTERRGEFVFYGEAMDSRRDWQNWKGMLSRAGVADHPLHAARNTTATLLMAAGVDVKLIAQILGHATVKITQDAYQQGDEEMLAGAMKMLEVYVAPVDEKSGVSDGT